MGIDGPGRKRAKKGDSWLVYTMNVRQHKYVPFCRCAVSQNKWSRSLIIYIILFVNFLNGHINSFRLPLLCVRVSQLSTYKIASFWLVFVVSFIMAFSLKRIFDFKFNIFFSSFSLLNWSKRDLDERHKNGGVSLTRRSLCVCWVCAWVYTRYGCYYSLWLILFRSRIIWN